MRSMNLPSLYIVVPCYNEEAVLPITAPILLEKLTELVRKDMIHKDSRILFVNDGSKDTTWSIIKQLSLQDEHYIGICQSRNRGHQNAVLAGLMEAKEKAEVTISIDCDGQDDIGAINEMIQEYRNGAEIVYGVRKKRQKDSWFKRWSAQSYYRVLKWLGADIIYNHADYRLVSSKVLRAFSDFQEVNIFLRGMFPLVGFRSTCVYYERNERLAGKTHYPLNKMVALAIDGITCLSTKPLNIIMGFGTGVSLLSFIGIVWAVVAQLAGKTMSGWASMFCLICFIGGIQLICIGVIGQYIGKIYLEVKHRPRYIISDTTWEEKNYDL